MDLSIIFMECKAEITYYCTTQLIELHRFNATPIKIPMVVFFFLKEIEKSLKGP